MDIIVCLKQVPDTNQVRIDPDTGTLIRQGIPSIMNPDDKAGLEAALRIKDQVGATVKCVTMGPLQAEDVLREAYAMGADEGYLITDRAFGGADTWATSQTLASAIRKLDYDLIITGRQAIDGDTAQVGPELAEHLSIPNISYVQGMEIQEDNLIFDRQFEDRIHRLWATTPILISVLSELNEPRYMTPSGIFSAYEEKEVVVWNRGDLDVEDSNIGLKGSPTRVSKSFPKEVKAPGMKIEENVDELVQFTMDRLIEKHIV